MSAFRRRASAAGRLSSSRNSIRSLPSTLQQVLTFLSTQPYSLEVLVVENASQDRTLEVAQAFARQNPQLKAEKAG